eukprot:CAMPEP_0202431250 /NCGR_PEP_ID=MMETSP1345-20130828/4879_1 /ASSEMBLY_ACC=CAM_ASM_000843 /TAXON_ID=342563 /ORGANISM="Fabrea Fabrea salina" /LENGTH=89 /DNA_ID=CAMNT_0049042889 /DNA_START=226 /DNA_END=496 /DNA_ORIENTATION=+
MPTGSTFCLSHITLGQMPNFPDKYFSRMIAKPRGDNMNLEWMSPYKSEAFWKAQEKLRLEGPPHQEFQARVSFPKLRGNEEFLGAARIN